MPNSQRKKTPVGKKSPINNKKAVPKSLNFKYLYNKDYHPEYASGALGSLTPRGDIVLNFYFERNPLPKEQSFDISSDMTINTTQPPVRFKPEDLDRSLVRQVLSGVIINEQAAQELIVFLQNQITEVKERREKEGEEQ